MSKVLAFLIANKSVDRANVGKIAWDLGAAAERERIIQIIDSLDIQFDAPDGVDYIAGDALDLIALIKDGCDE
jgi:hypothetical protein